MKRTVRPRWLAILCVVVLGLTGAACSSAKSTNNKAPTTLHTVMSEEADDLNPFTPTLQGKSQILSTIGMPMLYVDSTSKLTSRVLKSWTASPDAKTITLVLKPNIQWSDGKPMTSADLLMSLTDYLDAKVSVNAGRIGPVVGLDALASGKAKTISGLSAPDKSTLVIKLVNPDAAWLPRLALLGAYWPVLPSHLLGNVPRAKIATDPFFKTWPVSSGPYLLSKFVRGQYVEVTRNPKWSAGKAGFEKVIFEILSTDQMTAQLQTGEVQYVYTVDPSDVDRIKRISGVTVASHNGVAPELFGLNNGGSVFKDPRVRQAMLYAIDRAGICKTILAGHCTTPTANLRQIAPSWALPTTGLTDYNYDPAKAKQLLKDANWDPNTKLTFLARTQRSYVDKAVTAAVGQLNAAGMHFSVRNVTTAQLLDSIGKKTGWDAFWVSGADFVVDPNEWGDYLKCAGRYPDGPNTSQYCDPATDKLFADGLKTTDQAARASLYHQAFTKLNQSPAEVYLYVVDTIVAYNSHLTGVTVSGNLSGGYWDIGQWRWKA
jgi:peptide/nickel transport system substrate-binding protein